MTARFFSLNLFPLLFLFLGAGAVQAAPVDNAWQPKKKKIIELSWSNPDVDYLVANVRRMEAEAPLDGITIRLYGRTRQVDGKDYIPGTPTAFGREPWQVDDFAEAVAKLKTVSFTRFTDNFLQATVRPGDVDWFRDSDWDAVAGHFAILARIARETGLRGIVFDPEEYARRFWDHARLETDQDFATTAPVARRRGRQWGEAIFREYPDIVLFCLHLFTLGHPETSLTSAFFNGMLDVLPPTATVVEGHENGGYRAKNAADIDAARLDKDWNLLPRVAAENVPKYRLQVQLALAFYVDAIFLKDNSWHPILGPEADRDPAGFLRRQLTRALEVSDEYVWLWSEKCSWWPQSIRPSITQTWDDIQPGALAAVAIARQPENFDFATANLLPNPQLKDNGAHWMFWQTGKPEVKPGRDLRADGLLQLAGVNEGCFHQNLPVEPGATYILKVTGRYETPTPGFGAAVVTYQNDQGVWEHNHQQTVSLPKDKIGDWVTVVRVFRAPDGVATLSFQLAGTCLGDGIAAFKEAYLARY